MATMCRGCGKPVQPESVATTLRRVKTITSYAGHARFLAECDETIPGSGDMTMLGTIPDADREAHGIRSPYAYSPVRTVFSHPRHGAVAIFETAHKRFEVFTVAGPLGPIDTE